MDVTKEIKKLPSISANEIADSLNVTAEIVRFTVITVDNLRPFRE